MPSLGIESSPRIYTNPLKRKKLQQLDKVGLFSKRILMFGVCCRLIALTSGLDAYLAYHYRQSIFDLEQNQYCLMLMKLEPEHLSVFLVGKFLGTAGVILISTLVHKLNSRVGMAVVSGLSLFQIGLLTYQFCW